MQSGFIAQLSHQPKTPLSLVSAVLDRGLTYSADRAGGGLHVLRLTGAARESVSSPASN